MPTFYQFWNEISNFDVITKISEYLKSKIFLIAVHKI